MLSLTLIGCVSASDVNETVSVSEDVVGDSVIENPNICEDTIDDVSHNNTITNDMSDYEYTSTIVDDNSHNDNHHVVVGEKSDVDVVVHNDYNEYANAVDNQFNDQIINVNDNFNNDNFSDAIFEIDQELTLDATSNSNPFLYTHVEITYLFQDITYFETSILKSDFGKNMFKDAKIRNTNSLKHDLIVYEYTHESFCELTFSVVVCCNKSTDNFAYSINNSVIGRGEA